MPTADLAARHERDKRGVDIVCDRCGERWPVVDIAFDVFVLHHEWRTGPLHRPRGSRKQRRLTQTRRLQLIRRYERNEIARLAATPYEDWPAECPVCDEVPRG